MSIEQLQEKLIHEVKNINPSTQARQDFASAVVKSLAVQSVSAARTKDLKKSIKLLFKSIEKAQDSIKSLENALIISGLNGRAIVSKSSWRTSKKLGKELNLNDFDYFLNEMSALTSAFMSKNLNVSERSPGVEAANKMSLAIAQAYYKHLGKMPAHSSTDHGKNSKPFDRCCDAINLYLTKTGKNKITGLIKGVSRKAALAALKKL